MKGNKKPKTFRVQNRLVRGPFVSTTGAISQQITLTPTNIVNTTLASGYQVLYEEARIWRVQVKLFNSGAYVVGGFQVVYLDREPGDPIVPNIGTASTEPESSMGFFNEKISVTWVPRSPLEKEYQQLTAWSAPASINVLAASNLVTDAFSIYMEIISDWEYRGRDF